MKVMISSNAPWAKTGYGTQTNQLARCLIADGHEVAVSAFYGLAGTVLEWNGMRVYPGVRDAYGNDILTAHAAHFFGGNPKDGLVITLIDAWVLNPAILKRLNVCSWVPIDHDPAPPGVVRAIRDGGAQPVAMSRHGERMLRDAGLDPVYAPHGIDTSVLYPVDRAEARDVVGLPHDAFVVGMVAANKGKPSRKAFAEAFQAFAEFRGKHSDAMLFLHTEASGQFDGVDLRHLLAACDIPAEAVRFTDQYQAVALGHPDGFMRFAYSAMDVLMNPAYGEGFGIPVVEAQACGTPVVVQDFTAMSELGSVGWQVGGQRFWTPQGSWQRVPDVGQLAHALGDAHKMASGMREAAVVFARGYDHKRVFAEHWAPILDRLEAMVVAPVPTVERVA